jgi:citrate lyase beta subunit
VRAIAHQEQKLAQQDDTPTHTIQRAGERGVKNPSSCIVPLALVDGLRRSAASSAALGFDGKWALHPDQIEAVNQAFAPSPADYSRAVRIIEAYEHATTVQARGAVMLGDEMIDEASRKMAEVIVARGNAAGYAEIPKATE